MAIVADDLTGALDVCAPFAAKGLRCHVATVPDGVEAALAQDGDVICVNTATREMAAGIAGAIVARIAQRLADAGPEIAFKKIDSRLKGHAAVESRACLVAFKRRRAVIVPAVPDQGRFVVGGRLTGMGVAAPLSIADVFGNAFAYEAPDSAEASDLERIARIEWADVLFVGASGLAAGLASVLSSRPQWRSGPICAPILIAVGSHDPITVEQVARTARLPDTLHLTSSDGGIEMPALVPPVTIVQATVPLDAPDRTQAMVRFGASVAWALRRGWFRTMLLSGGETAQTVLSALAIDCVEVLGEALPGIPAVQAQIADRPIGILTKSGGFGTPDDILRLAETARLHLAQPSIAGEQA
ncbi:four-carbon acid sugar kinase family protein [Chelativorans sp. AA-79]|uniref:four-carbon acid sugar kinase family protein n=1 Tax=Chelativorans sp. AA-79 TaxID=3028735 RepID=UPI0023F7318C|nr:four-carbon acid sugar kinase family protein [Chelativorans sp. AA-79]WEX11278.1 four-carbon acid sugar kinase family protein [Chelativorans sp. AA-79]